MPKELKELQHTAVKSSNITSVAYDPAAQELEVQFKNGGRYRYAGVPATAHAALMAADSVGAHFHQHIKSAFKGTPSGTA